MTDEVWNTERLHDHFAQSLRVSEMYYDSKTGHQRLKVFQNGTFGRVLTLDDVVQTTEGDNFIYHEMLTHVPILAHGAAKRVLIIGGGDGGIARTPRSSMSPWWRSTPALSTFPRNTCRC